MDRDYILAPPVVSVSFERNEVFVQAQSLALLNDAERLSGLGSWISDTYAALTPAQRRDNLLALEVGGILLYDFIKSPYTHDTLPDYVDWLAQQDAAPLIHNMAETWCEKCAEHPSEWQHPLPEPNALLHDRDTFVAFMSEVAEREGMEDLWNEAFDLLQQPAEFVERLCRHVHVMWDSYLKAEWERAQPLLIESIEAFQRIDLTEMTLYEVIRTVTGRDVQGKFDDYLEKIDRVVFTPSPHLGPYIAKLPDGATLHVLYGARLPRGFQIASSPLTRSELLTRMNALADDSRLRILEMLTQHDELCAQDIIEMLGLSQSSVSRHLSQLSATGFLVERRRDVNKCYSLNVDRVVDTVRALTNFLSRQ